MSKVAIQGNASGTGTFTIAAPNSNTDRTLTLPDEAGTVLTSASSIPASSVTGLTQGITQADIFRITANISIGSETVITTNFERVDDATAGLIGSGMSEASGIFTFPETGMYLILPYFDVFNGSADSRSIDGFVSVSTDSGSNWDDLAVGKGFTQVTQGSNTHLTFSTSAIVDVTNVSTYRVRFRMSSTNYNGLTLKGDTVKNCAHFTFIRLGDT